MIKPAKDALDVNIFVSNIKASLNFYQNLLGLEFIREVPIWFGTLHVLQFGNSSLRLTDPKTIPPKGPIGIEGQLGYRYITFDVQNLSEICSRLQSEGVEFSLPEKEVIPGIRIAMAKDPDGNIVEFVERS